MANHDKSKKLAHVTDPVPRFTSGPVKTRKYPREWDGLALLTEKQWATLADWIKENRALVEASSWTEVAEVASISRSKFELSPFVDKGWTACEVGAKSIDRNSIQEACKLAGVEIGGSRR